MCGCPSSPPAHDLSKHSAAQRTCRYFLPRMRSPPLPGQVQQGWHVPFTAHSSSGVGCGQAGSAGSSPPAPPSPGPPSAPADPESWLRRGERGLSSPLHARGAQGAWASASDSSIGCPAQQPSAALLLHAWPRALPAVNTTKHPTSSQLQSPCSSQPAGQPARQGSPHLGSVTRGLMEALSAGCSSAPGPAVSPCSRSMEGACTKRLCSTCAARRSTAWHAEGDDGTGRQCTAPRHVSWKWRHVAHHCMEPRAAAPTGLPYMPLPDPPCRAAPPPSAPCSLARGGRCRSARGPGCCRLPASRPGPPARGTGPFIIFPFQGFNYKAFGTMSHQITEKHLKFRVAVLRVRREHGVQRGYEGQLR